MPKKTSQEKKVVLSEPVKSQKRPAPKARPETSEDLLNTFKDLKGLYDTPGGQVLVSGLVDDIVSRLSIISTNYGILPHQELMAQCASIGEKLQLVRVLTRSRVNYEGLQKELALTLVDEALRE